MIPKMYINLSRDTINFFRHLFVLYSSFIGPLFVFYWSFIRFTETLPFFLYMDFLVHCVSSDES